jgi:hypothetical protein
VGSVIENRYELLGAQMQKNQIPPHPTFLFDNRLLAPKGEKIEPSKVHVELLK